MSALPAFSRESTITCFTVRGPAEPSVMPRVLEVFARRGLVPSQWHSTVCGAPGESLEIDVQVAGLDRPGARRLAQSLRQLVCVDAVMVSEKRHALTA